MLNTNDNTIQTIQHSSSSATTNDAICPPVAPVAYQVVIVEPGIGQFRECESFMKNILHSAVRLGKKEFLIKTQHII